MAVEAAIVVHHFGAQKDNYLTTSGLITGKFGTDIHVSLLCPSLWFMTKHEN